MFEEIETKKKHTALFTVLGVFVLLAAIAGVAVAAYTWNYTSSQANTIGTGNISMSLLESTDVISINNALPMSDTDGKAQNETDSFDFAVTTNASGAPGNINYTISITKLDPTDSYTRLPDNNVKSDVLTDVNEDKNFKNLQKKLKKGKGIDFDKLVGEFSYSDNILTLKELVASSKYIGFQILASGTVNTSESKVDINGLFVPLGIINGLFGMNKLPLISDIIFGQKNAGLFASKFEITKNKDEKMNIKINKFSTILPGFLRNLLIN